MTAVRVYVDGIDDAPVFAGTLEPSFMGAHTLAGASFAYSSDYLKHPGSYEISPELPLRTARSYTDESRTMFGAFNDAAPDEWGQRIIDANNAMLRKTDPSRPRRLGAFDYLLGVSDRTRIGALRFQAAGGTVWLSEDSGVANMHALTRVIAAAERYERNAATDDDVAYLSGIATSPGGARPKANVITDAGRLAIAKLPHSKDGNIDVEAWEAVALTIASKAHLHTPVFTLRRVGPAKSVLITERFDRDDAERRYGYMSAATALGLGEHNQQHRTYVDYADTIATLTSREDLRELYGRIALTVLINNVDDHWRNHGLLRGREGWTLSPVFDVNPSRSTGIITSRPIDDDDDPRARDLRNLFDSRGYFSLTEDEANETLHRVGHAVSQWQKIAEDVGIDRDEIGEMSVAFDEAQLDYALNRPAPDNPASQRNPTWVPPHTRNGKPVRGHHRNTNRKKQP